MNWGRIFLAVFGAASIGMIACSTAETVDMIPASVQEAPATSANHRQSSGDGETVVHIRRTGNEIDASVVRGNVSDEEAMAQYCRRHYASLTDDEQVKCQDLAINLGD